MNNYKNEATDCVNLFESAIIGIHFNNRGTQIVFDIDWLEGDGDGPFTVECDCCHSIDFCFKHEDEQLGELCITGFSYLKTDKEYTIQFNFDFTPKGYIRLNCCDFYFHVPSSPLQEGGNNHRIPWDSIKVKDPLDY